MEVDGVSVSQLYDMRSDKEERRAGGFPPEEDDETAAMMGGGGGGGGDDGGPSSRVAAARCCGAARGGSSLGAAAAAAAGGGALSKEAKNSSIKQVEQKLAEVELDRTLCMNRIAQLEEELDALKEAKADALTDARLNNEFLGRGFADLQALLEAGFKQLEKFYLETGGAGHGGGGGGGGMAGRRRRRRRRGGRGARS